MYNMYDEDSVDLEEQLYLQEVQEELDAEEAALEDEEDEEEIDPLDYTLAKSFLESQIKRLEPDRTILKIVHNKTRKIFEGYVLGQSSTGNNKFVFLMSEVTEDGVGEKKTKIFNFADIRKY